ncbi:MAG: hypothetical protein NZ844_09895, partial [Chloroherpetonaceae bacterium]|nr:hypothetical protein [Chloroherpetonaceae bacterium]
MVLSIVPSLHSYFFFVLVAFAFDALCFCLVAAVDLADCLTWRFAKADFALAFVRAAGAAFFLADAVRFEDGEATLPEEALAAFFAVFFFACA